MWTKKNSGSTSLPIADVSTLGGVKVGTGLSITADGTLSTSTTTTPLADQVTGVYLVPNKLNITMNSSSQAVITPYSGQTVWVYYLSKAAVSYTLPSITITNNQSLRFNPSTGAFRSGWDTQSNEIVLLTNTSGALVSGMWLDYIKDPNMENVEIICPKDYTSKTRSGSTSGICFVGSEMWVFAQTTDDTHTATAGFNRYDATNNSFTLISTATHNIGHCNTVDYNATTDSLIIGNGSKDYTLLPKVWIFPNATSWKGMTNIDWNTIPKYEIDFTSVFTEGKCQAVWGENNFGGNDIIYLILNDNKHMAKILLGKGSNNLGNGTFNSSATSTDFNGTFKVIDEWFQFDGGGVNQDTFYYNGAIYANTNGTGSIKGLLMYKHKLCANGTIKKAAIRFPMYDSTGTLVGYNGEGLAFYNNKIYANFDTSTNYTLIWFDII